MHNGRFVHFYDSYSEDSLFSLLPLHLIRILKGGKKNKKIPKNELNSQIEKFRKQNHLSQYTCLVNDRISATNKNHVSCVIARALYLPCGSVGDEFGILKRAC